MRQGLKSEYVDIEKGETKEVGADWSVAQEVHKIIDPDKILSPIMTFNMG